MIASAAGTDDEQLAPLTVEGLIEELSKFPSHARVVVDGYEDGYDNVDAESRSAISIRPKPDHKDWEGENEDAGWHPGANDIEAVRIARKVGF